jgi:serine dehydrogenase proteinase
MRLLGFPLVRYIDIHDSEDVLRAIYMTDDDVPLDIVLHTLGGLVLAALQIAHAIRAHKGEGDGIRAPRLSSGATVDGMLGSLGIFCMTRVRFGHVKRVAGGACALHFHFAQDLRCGLRQPSRPSLAPLSISGGHFGRPAN